MSGLRVLVCGGRDYVLHERIFAVLDRFHSKFGIGLLVHGGATGADTLAGDWAASRAIPCLRVPADWNGLGRSAGPARNALMLHLGKPECVLAFPGGRGTADMMEQARKASVHVIEIPARRE